MEPGPSTLRPHLPAAQVAEHLRHHSLAHAVVTDPEGRLLGIAHLSDLATNPGRAAE